MRHKTMIKSYITLSESIFFHAYFHWMILKVIFYGNDLVIHLA
jgi:hypothetical protein